MTVLTPELLARIRSRAAGYDRDNAFFTEDLDELRAVGYLNPRSLTEAVSDQRLLAAHAPATALGIGMHLTWTGVARVLADRGDDSMNWVLQDAAAGELFAFAISERGNDVVLWDSSTVAAPVGVGGWSFTGKKSAVSLSPAWTRLGVFGKYTPEPRDTGQLGAEAGVAPESPAPQMIHGFLTRDTSGWHHLGDWNTLGMRASQSHGTVLDGAVVAEGRVSRILPVGPNADPFVFGIFANFLVLIGAVYAGIADRALELAVESVQRRTSTRSGESYANDPDFRWRVADAALAVDALGPQLAAIAADVDNRTDHGQHWFRLLTGVKHRATETARHVVDQAMRCAGGAGFAAESELARLQRDVLAGIYHPSSTESVHATVASDLLG